MTTKQDLIAQLRALGIPDWAMARVLMTQAADTLEALQAEIERLNGYVQKANMDVTAACVERDKAFAWLAELEISNAELERLCDATYVAQGADAYNHACECMEAFQEKRRATGKEVGTTHSLCDGMGWVYRRLDELEAQNLMARQIILEHGEGVAGASLVATPIVAWAKSTPRKLRITTMDMGGEDGWRPLGYTAAGASPVEPSQAQPEPVNVGLMELLEPAFTEIQHVLGSTLEVPYQRKSLETALELVRAAIAVIKQSQPDYEAMHKKGFQAFDCPVCGFDGALGFQPAAQPSQAGELELSDSEIKKISSDLSLYEDYQPESCQADYLDPVKFARAIIAVINAKEQPNG